MQAFVADSVSVLAVDEAFGLSTEAFGKESIVFCPNDHSNIIFWIFFVTVRAKIGKFLPERYTR